MRDLGALEAALFRPQCGYYADTFDEAAALWESLAQNHPFVDGNKRTAFAATYTFLRLNGILLIADANSAFRFIDGLYTSRQFEFRQLAKWLRENTNTLR
jgi:death-on-curing protein